MSDEDDCSCEKRNWINTFEGRISPLLLLHRLILMFGIQSVYNASESIHDYLYYIHLIHEDGTSDLNFDYLSEDFVQIQFQGTEAASNEALKLLSSLCGVEDLHRVWLSLTWRFPHLTMICISSQRQCVLSSERSVVVAYPYESTKAKATTKLSVHSFQRFDLD